jgi:predicted NAD-dependent protein-ADP-ribosyltransferase YbiA (DUF1768 family)
MANIIELFNPNDKPFGKLSNNAYHPMTIDGKKYDTVTNYIYSNMLTTPTLRMLIQNTKIRGASGINQELMNAIDFLVEDHTKPTVQTKELPPKINQQARTTMIRYLTTVTKKPSTRYRTMDDVKLSKTYKKFLNKYGKSEAKPLDDEEIKQSWVDYAKTGKLKEQEKAYEKSEEYKLLISRQVRKPFDSIDLVQLKNQITTESARNQMGIYQLYNRSKSEETFNTIYDAIHKGYEARFQIPELQNILISTGNVPIIYESNDSYMGIGADGKGYNIVGKSLMQLRHNLRVKSVEKQQGVKLEKKYKNIYNIYISYLILRKEMVDNKKTLTEYLGLRPNQIISKYGLKNLKQGVPTQETVIQLFKNDKVPDVVMREIFNPGTLAINVRKMGLRQLRNQLLRDKNDLVFNSYLEYMVNKKYEEEINNEAEKQFHNHAKTKMRKASVNSIKKNITEGIIARQKAELSPDKLEKLKERIVDLFKLGMLSASLSDRIDADVESLQIPTDEDVEEAEIAEVLPLPVDEIIPDKNESSSMSSASSGSYDGSPITKMMKTVFKDDKIKRKDMISTIISIKGSGKKSDYNDWSNEDLKNRLEALETDKWEGKNVNDVHDNIDPNAVYIEPSGQPIKISRDETKNTPDLLPFNPESYTGMLLIDNMNFPTIQHYMIAKLISTTGTKRNVDSYGSVSLEKGMGILESQKAILVENNSQTDQPEYFLTLHLAGEKYDVINTETNNFLLRIYTATSLNKKFEDRGFQDLLLLTGDTTIHWTGTENFVLGVGTKEQPGENYIGVTMMEIREKLKISRETDEEVDIEVGDISKFVNKDPFIMDWVKMRVNDMCGVVYKLQQYLKFKDGIDIDISEEERMTQLVEYVLDTVYQPCGSLISIVKKFDSKVPNFFIDIVIKCKGMSSGLQSVYKTDNSGNKKLNDELQELETENTRAIGKIDSEFWGGTRIDHSISKSKEFEEQQRTEWQEFWQQLNESEAPKSEKDQLLKEFKEVQQNEYNEFWGIQKGQKTQDEVYRHEHKIKEIEREFRSFLQKKIGSEKHFYKVSTRISQIYWNRIAVMLSVLIQHVRPSTSKNIRDVLVKSEILISETTNCVRVIANEQDNCIVSAILNLLTGIIKFKEEFSGNIELDVDDVILAGSIILNSKFQPTLVNEDINDSENDEQDNDDKQDDNFDVNPGGYFPSDNEDEYNREADDYGDVSDGYSENPYFAFKGGSKPSKDIVDDGDLAKVEQQVIQISPENSTSVALQIMKTVKVIKTSNVAPKVKQNRINFFATIR